MSSGAAFLWACLAAAVAGPIDDEVALLQALAAGPPATAEVSPSLTDLAGDVGGVVVPEHPDVARWVGLYTSTLREPMQRWLGRLDGQRDMLTFILQGEGLPEALAVVPLVESGMLTEATSVTGCAGTWQLATPTALALGLVVGPGQDDRRDPVLATGAGAALLRELRQRYQRWDLALAAYNAGPQRVDEALAACGSSWDALATELGTEPRHFVAKVYAAMVVDSHRERLGLVVRGPGRSPQGTDRSK